MRYAIVAAMLVASVAAVPFPGPDGHNHWRGGHGGRHGGQQPSHDDEWDGISSVTEIDVVSTTTVDVTITMSSPAAATVQPAEYTPEAAPAYTPAPMPEIPSKPKKPSHKHKAPSKPTIQAPPPPAESPEAYSPPPAYSPAPSPEPSPEPEPSAPSSSPAQPPADSGSGSHAFPYPSPAPTQTYWSAPSGQSAPTCSGADQSYISTALTYHNDKRAIHQANPLVWDDALACIAQQQANTCDFAHLIGMGGGGYGQNIAGTGLADSMQMWYDEGSMWASNYGNPDAAFSDSTGHFTAMVWASSTALGCGTASCGGSGMAEYTVCNYFVFPNMAGEFAANVLAPK